MAELRHDKWKGTTDGSPWMQKMLIRLLHRMPLGFFYFCVALAVPFYMVFRPKGYRASYRFFRLRIKMNPAKAFCHAWTNHFRFGQIIIDRFAAYAGREFVFETEGQQLFDVLEREEKGFMQLSSHVGNYELAGYSLKPARKKFFALVFSGEKKTIMDSRSELFSAHNVVMVPVNPDMSHIFVLNEAIGAGNIVSMPADRIFGSPRGICCQFLGCKAKFPMGPFAMAEQRGLPVLSVFVMKTGTDSYKIHVRRIEGRDRNELCLNYVEELEKIIKQYPTQWFNFYDFWM